jgi:hypothetical protein
VVKNSKNVVIQQILEKMPPCKAWFSCEEKPLANNKEAAPWHDMQGVRGTSYLSITFGPPFFGLSGRSSSRSAVNEGIIADWPPGSLVLSEKCHLRI